jgi:predicted nucleotide-binding protein (sugar kinase/HSP70/actin superfamily)
VRAHAKFQSLVKDVSSGELFLSDFVELAKLNSKNKKSNEIDKNWKEKFTTLMKLNNLNEKQINARLRQLDIFLKMKSIQEIITVLFEIKKQNNLTGDFGFLEKITDSVSIFYFIN